MNAHEFLNQYFMADRKQKLLEREIATLSESITDIKATDYTKVIVDGTKNPDVIGDLLGQLEEKKVRLLKAKLNAHKKMHTVLTVITKVEDPLEGEVLFSRYIELKKWEKIADEMIYSTRNLYYIRDKAYRSVEKIIKES